MASDLLLRLAVITGNEDYTNKALPPMRTLSELMSRAPAGTGRWLAALDFYVSTPKEIAIVGPGSIRPRPNCWTRSTASTWPTA